MKRAHLALRNAMSVSSPFRPVALLAVPSLAGLLAGCVDAPMKDWERLAHSLVEPDREQSLRLSDTKKAAGGKIEFTFLSRRKPEAIRESSQAICRAQDWRSEVTQSGVECSRMGGEARIGIRSLPDGLVAVTVSASGD